MCQSFSSMGVASAEREIEQAENSPSTTIHSEIKPFTTKVDAHVIESLDAVAQSLGISRNTLVVKLINHYLGAAFEDFHAGRFIVFDHTCSMEEKTSEQFVLKELEKITPNLSPEAKRYLDRLVVGQVIGDL